MAIPFAVRIPFIEQIGCEMSTRFMRPGLGCLRALGEVMHATASLAFCEGRVLDDKGQLCAHATATFKYLRALPVSGKQVHASSHHIPSAQAALRGAGSD